MAEQPLATVWIASYNHAAYLPQSIESARAQTYPNLEILILDDGSSDGSLEIARTSEARDTRIRVITHAGHANRGISATVNALFEESRGAYVTGLPSDDLLAPDSVARRIAVLEADPGVGFVYGPVEMLEANGQRTGWIMGPSPEQVRQLDATSDLLLAFLVHTYMPAMSMLWRREIFAACGPFDEDLVYSDLEWAVRLLAHTRPGYASGPPLAGHRKHERSTSLAAPQSLSERRRLDVFRSLDRKAVGVGGRLAEPRVRALIALQRAWYAALVGEEDEAAEETTRAVDLDSGLSDDLAFLLWWLGPRQKSVKQDWLVGALMRAACVRAVVEVGARRGHFGCRVVMQLEDRVSPSVVEELRWSVLANEIQLDMRKAFRLLAFGGLLFRAIRCPKVVRSRAFLRAALCSLGLWETAIRVRARR